MPSTRLCFIPICIIRSRRPRRLGVNPDSEQDVVGCQHFHLACGLPFASAFYYGYYRSSPRAVMVV